MQIEEMLGRYTTRVSAILGNCPTCQGDGLQIDTEDNIWCKLCETRWKALCDLPTSKKLGDGMPMLVVLWFNPRISSIEIPSREQIQHERLITTILNSALICRFGLGQNFSCEGGVEGRYTPRPGQRQRYAEFRNGYSHLGLSIGESYMAQDPYCVRMLKWHFDLMRLLVTGKFRIGKRRLPAGATFIEELSETDIMLVCYRALARHMRSKEKAKTVFQKMDQMKSGLFGSYLAGLTDDDLVKLFVAPPA